MKAVRTLRALGDHFRKKYGIRYVLEDSELDELPDHRLVLGKVVVEFSPGMGWEIRHASAAPGRGVPLRESAAFWDLTSEIENFDGGIVRHARLARRWLRRAEKWESMPKGWTDESRAKFWDTLTGDVKHKVTKCIKKMEGKDGIDDPGAFCAALADRVEGSEWRKGPRKKKASPQAWAKKLLRELNTLERKSNLSDEAFVWLYQAKDLAHAATKERDSVSRFAEIWLAKNGKWYLDLTHDEYDYEPENATTYGPFFDEDAAERYLFDNFSNPGALDVDDRGTRPVPRRSPNGSPVQKPRRGFRWASVTLTYEGKRGPLDFDGRTYVSEASDLRLRKLPGTIQIQNRITGETDSFSNPQAEKDREGDIVKWVYRGPVGKTLVIYND